jgi:cytochrome c oxidase cbb3-type subunit 3
MNKRNYFFLAIIFALPSLAKAQDAGTNLLEKYQLEIILSLAALVCFVAFLALVVAWWGLRVIVRKRLEEQGVAVDEVMIAAQPGEEHLGFWARFWNRFNAAVPVAHEASVATDHEYDGIRELDNRLPPWWLYGFYFTIAFGVVYVFYYHFGGGMSQDQEFRDELKRGDAKVAAYKASLQTDQVVDLENVQVLTDASALAAGKQLFTTNCAQCHAKDGGGMVGLGPNLTDKYWKHGGDYAAILKVIRQGVKGTSMIPWETQLDPQKLQEVASFVYSLEGTVPAVAKDPEGELFERQAPETPPAAGDSTAVNQ